MEKAFNYQLKSLDLSIKIGSKHDELTCYDGLANTAYKMKLFENAIDYHRKALNLCKSLNLKPDELRCNLNFGHTLIAYAVECYLNAEKIADSQQKKEIISDIVKGVVELDQKIEQIEKKM
jgi:tetratricopeptide (TPR) repeat protein